MIILAELFLYIAGGRSCLLTPIPHPARLFLYFHRTHFCKVDHKKKKKEKFRKCVKSQFLQSPSQPTLSPPSPQVSPSKFCGHKASHLDAKCVEVANQPLCLTLLPRLAGLTFGRPLQCFELH